ncbi:hypothetical protein P7K49_029019 [Saguinus oedipus]|uniref:Uncharacterized protein n=1 Tax=Saguinus oedipus TaxID=9490 RepID=A0ABQ9U622_SAGOE|nr:hypothetical protein P7K49_029019 [Saguinus oedipus]
MTTTVATDYDNIEIQQQYSDVNNRWDVDDWDNENSSARLFERSRIKALAAEVSDPGIGEQADGSLMLAEFLTLHHALMPLPGPAPIPAPQFLRAQVLLLQAFQRTSSGSSFPFLSPVPSLPLSELLVLSTPPEFVP